MSAKVRRNERAPGIASAVLFSLSVAITAIVVGVVVSQYVKVMHAFAAAASSYGSYGGSNNY